MEPNKIDSIILEQREYFNTGATLSVQSRIANLKKLRDVIKLHEKEISDALYKDLGKSENESYMCEIGLALSEITYMIKHVKRFTKEKRVRTPLSQFASRSYKKPCPYGNVLIMSPWNYPFLLTIEPLCNALAAGNTAVIKPSAYSPATSKVIEDIIEKTYPTKLVAVVTGGRKENATLLEKKFDLIFFTGSQAVGKEVLKKASEHLTPAILELGGKSPCIVDKTANIKLAAKRIVFGKFLNCGQTCVAPDYILIDKSIKDKFVEEVKKQITIQYTDSPLTNSKYGKIINDKHFDRLTNLIDKEKVVFGGDWNIDTKQISPTVMDNVTWNDAVMQEEIFGPIMPILTYENFEDIFTLLQDKQKPLALYLFSSDKKHILGVTSRLSYGGGCINDTIIHLATSEMGFGGVGESGMGSYHGKDGFDAFSHTKSIVNKKTWIDLPMRYQPYSKEFYNKLIRWFLK
ncbi:MAG: aldehyde dehydrogenase [Clostridia bacterium]|nr:aldehyde dehydrogenase [Clostridia bacterium]